MKNYILIVLIATSTTLYAQNISSKAFGVKSTPINSYDKFAQFPFGDFDKYVVEKLKLPDSITGFSSTIYLTLKVDSLGKASIYALTPKLAPELFSAFKDVILHSPKWTPALLDGKPVTVYQYSGYTIYFDKSLSTEKVKVHYLSEDKTPDSNSVYTATQVQPKFPGGQPSFNQFISKNISSKSGKFQGAVFTSFIVEKDGSLTDIKVVNAPTVEIGIEAKRLLRLSPKWTPGMSNGKVVRVQWMQPIFFQLR